MMRRFLSVYRGTVGLGGGFRSSSEAMHIDGQKWRAAPSITTTVPKFGQFLAGNYFAEGKAAKLSSAWTGDMKRCSRPLS